MTVNWTPDFIRISPVFPLMSFFWSRNLIQDPTLPLVVTSPWCPLVSNSFCVPSVSTSLTILKRSGQKSVRLSLRLGFSDVFLMTGRKFWVWGKNTSEAKCPSCHMISGGTWCPHDLLLVTLTLITWWSWGRPGFPHWDVYYLPFPVLCSLEASGTHTRGTLLLPDGRIYLCPIIWDSSVRRISVLFPYLCNQSVIKDLCLHMSSLWAIVQYWVMYFVRIVPALAIGSSFHGLLCPFGIPSSLCTSFFLSTSLLPGTAWCSRLVLHILCPSVRISHYSKFPGFFYWRMVLEVKSWVPGVPVATRVSLLLVVFFLFIWVLYLTLLPVNLLLFFPQGCQFRGHGSEL